MLDELQKTREVLEAQLDALTKAAVDGKAPITPAVTGGLRANLMRRLDRFERRLIAASKKEHAEIMRELATARGSLYPFGKPQERAISFIQFLARYGDELKNAMLAEAGKHAARFVSTASHRDAVQGITASGRA